MVYIIDHPLIKHKLTIMRKKETCSKDFRENLDEIASLMAYEVTKNVNLKEINITTPICDTIGYEVKDDILIVPILRAGLGLVDGFKKVIPTAAIGHIGLARDEETFKPFKAYPLAFPNGFDTVVALKGDDDTAHRHIMENDIPDDGGDDEYVQPPIPF